MIYIYPYIYIYDISEIYRKIMTFHLAFVFLSPFAYIPHGRKLTHQHNHMLKDHGKRAIETKRQAVTQRRQREE